MRPEMDFNRFAPGDEYANVARNYKPLGLELTYGEGPYVFASDGTSYVDAIAGYGAGQFGHRHPKIVAAARTQIDSQPEISALIASGEIVPGQKIDVQIARGGLDLTTRNYTNPILAEYTQKLARFSGILDPIVLPKNGGGEIVDSAIKIMRADGVRRRDIPENEGIIITFQNCFHGRTYGAVSASSSHGVKRDFGPFLPGFVSVPYDDINALEAVMQANRGKILGVLIEPVQGEAGVKIPKPGYLQGVQDLCSRYNTILVLDEIQSGWGRTGTTWAYQQMLRVPPDILLTAKGVGTGLVASSACIGRAEIMKVLDYGSDGATMSGSPLACAIGIAAMEIMKDERIAELSAERGRQMARGLSVLGGNSMVRDLRSIGSWHAVELADEETAQAVAHHIVTQHHVLCVPSHESIRISPSLNIPPELVDYIAQSVVDSVRAFEAEPSLVRQYNFH